MEYLIGFIIAILALLAAVNVTKAKIVKVKATLPDWARFNPATSWKNKFFDRRPWLKRLLIGMLQFLIISTIFILKATANILKFAYQRSLATILPKKS